MAKHLRLHFNLNIPNASTNCFDKDTKLQPPSSVNNLRYEASAMSASEVIVTVWSTSDGVYVAPTTQSLHRDDGYYRIQLAQLWAKHTNRTRDGTTFKLDRLPTGYSGWEKTRAYPDGRRHVDRYLYGHPSGRPFDSVPKAWAHFQHWLDHGNNNGCPCVHCGGRQVTAPAQNQPAVNAPVQNQPTVNAPAQARQAVMTLDCRAISKTTPYSILGLQLDATGDQIRQAYTNRSLSVSMESSEPASYGHRSLIGLSRAKEILEDERPIGRALLDRCIRYARQGYKRDRPWEFLGVAGNASRARIEAAYRSCMANWS
ncbi:hypothetical protein CERZMDRAFT_95938 [Cercospora zeae-maydis SCOH1-5]|uniref:Cryptic loci regulator 2 N-terminal domain-containing protein n=1 Tax=Cercospora zeae-maydis SCOH1-5 TaxID=717836 RepID=A0A6A6FKC8_9PEZI|nr:hypothetical protein CERZMDRAFT_95938 [Cercospora zeae-maydis SCOH1-5]